MKKSTALVGQRRRIVLAAVVASFQAALANHAMAVTYTAADTFDLDSSALEGSGGQSVASGIAGGQQVGYGFGSNTGGNDHAFLWSGTAASAVDLNPSSLLGSGSNSVAYGVAGGQQVGAGYGSNTGGSGLPHALLWSGTAASAVDLNPSSLLGLGGNSFAFGISSGQEVGDGSGSNTGGNQHALLWSGTAASAVDLNPSSLLGSGSSSQAIGIGSGQEIGVGYGSNTGGNDHALLWSGTAASAVDLNPSALLGSGSNSYAYEVAGGQQIGSGFGSNTGGYLHALLWSGTAASAVDLNPSALLGSGSSSEAYGIAGGQQVGYGYGANTGGYVHALVWSGTAASAIDLNSLVPGGFAQSEADSIDAYGDIAGDAGNSADSVEHAVEWLAGDMFVAGSGNWSSSGNWTSGTPAAGNDVLIVPSDGASHTVTYDNSGSVALNNVTLDETGGVAILNFNQSQYTLSAVNETVGVIGSANYNLSGGTNTVSGSLTLGAQAGGNGNYSLSGTGSLSAASIYVGDLGDGDFKQTGGTANVSGNEHLGYSGGGFANLTGGTHTIGTNSSAADLFVGYNSGTSGKFTLGGTGTLVDYGAEVIGTAGTGTFIQNGGSNTIPAANTPVALSVGAETNSVGNYILNSGTLQVAGEEDIGISGSGTFTQTGGTNTIQTYLDIGYYYESGGVYYLGGTGQVTFSNPGGSVYVGGSSVGQADGGELSVSGGSIQIPHILEIYSFGDITQTGGTITAGATVNTGVINQSGGRAILGSVTGVNGELIIGAASGASAATTVNALNQYKAIINSTGFLTINGGTANNLGSLSISGNGQLDVTNHHLFINYAAAEDPDPIASIAAWIASGYAGGTWNGPGIMSTAAQANSGRYGIGYADSADPGNPAGLSSGQIEIMYTLLGDANLDGKVNGTDFNLMAANFNQAVTHGWDEGDFNYDGKVNGSDFVLLANNFNQFASQSAVSSADVNALDAFAAANGISLVNVPEPLSAGMMVIAGLGILNRRRRINC